ncbi:FAD-dependent monooxygenase [Kutzneria sp. NPDC052558]|uniref:FAD-dependent monooxygenase n=1 Tax=Kutzneria sp. NPDC052558 TaxID=3364121 RepID=UPI0037C96AFA
MTVEQVDALVIGAGPVGLSAAIQLTRAGVRTLVVERHEALSRHPKATGVHPRTMELFRQWGVADAIRDLSVPADHARGFAWTTRLHGGIELGELMFADGDTTISPEHTTFTSQDNVETVLYRALPAPVEFRTTAELLDQDDDGVTVALTADGSRRIVRAAYVIAADGTKSPTRKALGIAESATAPYGESVNIFFHSAELSRLTAASPHLLTWILNADLVGCLLTTGREDRWILNMERDPALADDAYDNRRCVQMIRNATGLPTLEPELLSVMRWKHEDAVADTWRVGRVFLAGDAVHRFPPHGGFGMNSGIQDVHNLVWKLALVLSGRASESLLDTYERERRPVAVANREQVVLNTDRLAETGWLADDAAIATIETAGGEAVRQAITAGIPAQREQFWSDGQQFGFLYRSAAVIDDATPPELSTISVYRPTGHPGARAPHLWLRDGDGVRRSTIDLSGNGFVVLAGHKGQSWQAAAAAIDVPAVVIGDDLVAESDDFEALYGIQPDGAVLVRPDGHVAMRSADATDATARLEAAMAAILHPAD